MRLLVGAGHDVHVVPTESALRFVGLPTWEALSRNPVTSSLYDGVAEVRHVALGQTADLIVIAPATANTVAKLAHGLSDDLLGTTVLASEAPVLIAPAMHTEMWRNPATQANVATLKSRGFELIGPVDGPLTGPDSGPGRMSEPAEIAARVEEVLARSGHGGSASSWTGINVLISGGGTRERLDPVRFLGNRSSGKQAVALAQAAVERGARVTLVGANLEVAVPSGVRLVPVESTEELRAAMHREASGSDVVIMAAAVADYRPVEPAGAKLKKSEAGERLNLELIANPDVLVELVSARRPGQVIVGFAAETVATDTALERIAREKQERKGADLLVANRVAQPGAEVFGADDSAVLILRSANPDVSHHAGSKHELARAILDAARPDLAKANS